MQNIQKATLIALLIGTIKADANYRSSPRVNTSQSTVYESTISHDNANQGTNQFDVQAPYYPEASEQFNTQRQSWETNNDQVPTGRTNGNRQQQSASPQQGNGPNDGTNQFETTEPYYPESNNYNQINQNSQRDSWNTAQESLQMGSTNGNSRAGVNNSQNTVYEYLNTLENANEGTNQFDVQVPYYPEATQERNNQRQSWDTNQGQHIPTGSTNGNRQQHYTAPMYGDGPNNGQNQFETTEPYYPESNNYNQINYNRQRGTWDSNQDLEVPMGQTNGNWEQNVAVEITRDGPNSGVNQFDLHEAPFYPEDTGSNFNTQMNFGTDQNGASSNEPVIYGSINGNSQAPESERINFENQGANSGETLDFVPSTKTNEESSINTQRASWDQTQDIPVDNSMNGNTANQHNSYSWGINTNTAPIMDYESFMQNHNYGNAFVQNP